VRREKIGYTVLEGGVKKEYRISEESLQEFIEGQKKQKPETVSEVESPKMQPSEPTES